MLFEVFNRKTGKPPIYDFNHLFKEKWFKESNLIWCDISAWIIDEDGNLGLTDDCNNIAYPPRGRYEIKVDFDELAKIGYVTSKKYIFYKKEG